jgi:hypothetical protein
VFWDQGLEDAVLCTHGETIGRLLGQLVADGLVGAAPLDWPKGSTWLLRRASRRVHARYLAPPGLRRAALTRPGAIAEKSNRQGPRRA